MPASDRSYDVAIVGAGPAGLAAAATAAHHGLAAVLLDEQPGPGGQIYRAIASTPVGHRRVLGEEYERGMALVAASRASSCTQVPGAVVWSVTREPGDPQYYEIGISVAGNASLFRARTVILATGALERPCPIPGWTLPGVMTAGAAQALLKASAQVPRGKTILAGSGPLLYLLARQYAAAGVSIAALVDTTPQWRLLRAMRHVLPFATSSYFAKGVGLVRAARASAPVFRHAFALEAEGGDRVRRLRFRTPNRLRMLDCDTLLLHQGVVPNVNLAMAIGCEHRWDDIGRCMQPQVDAWGATSVERVWIAGDGAGIAGAQAAEHSGTLAALDVAHAVEAIDEGLRDKLASAHRRRLQQLTSPRRFFDVLFAPARAFRVPADETIVCRCEEVTARQVRDAVAQGCTGPNQVKAFVRCGMGRCQGRLCGLTVTEIIADARGVAPRRVGYYRMRFPAKPLTLGELASMPQSEASQRAVVRSDDEALGMLDPSPPQGVHR